MKKQILAGVALALVAAPVAAQQGVTSARIAAAETKYAIALCPLQGGSKSANDGIKALKKAYEAKEPGKRGESLALARTLLLQGIASEGAAGSSNAWHHLARTYMALGDLGGADSAFARAQTLSPDCEIDINQHRQNAWAMLANDGLKFLQAGNADSALVLFYQSNAIFRGLPQVFSNVGVIYANRQQDDSAAVYFAKALEVAEKDSTMKAERDNAATNLSIMYTRTNRPAEAVKVLRQIVGWNPADNDAKKQLSEAFRAAGMADSATALENDLLAAFSKANLDSLSIQDLLSLGVGMFNAQKFPEAANAFAAVVKRNPNSRDGLYNLANSYFALKDNQNLVAVAGRLRDIDPMNEDVLRLLGMGYKELKQQDLLLKTAEQLVGLPVAIDVNGFAMGRTNATWSAVATGRDPQDITGKSLKAMPVTIVLEFLNDKGEVVSSAEAAVPALAKGATKTLSVKGAGDGISAWRYHAKP